MKDSIETAGAARLVEEFFEALNEGDAARLLTTVHPEIAYRFHIAGFEPVVGHEAMAAALEAIYGIFPDFHEELLWLRASENLVVAGWRITGSLAGPFPLPDGYALSAQRQPSVGVEGVDIFEIRDGLIARKDTFADPTPWYRAYAHLLNVT